MNRLLLSSLIALALAGCSVFKTTAENSEPEPGYPEPQKAATSSPAPKQAPLPATSLPASDAVSNLLIPPVGAFAPPPGRATAEPRFDLSVSDAPIGQVLSSLVVGTDYSMLLKPSSTPPAPPSTAGTAGAATPTPAEDPSARKISLNLKNVTLFEALESIRELYGYDYTVNGRRILVQPEEIQTRLYQVNYVLGQRRGVSDIQVVGGASTGGSSGGSSTGTTTTSGTSGSSYSSVQASGMSTTVKSDIWAEAEDSLRTLLSCNIPRTSSGGRVGTGGAALGGTGTTVGTTGSTTGAVGGVATAGGAGSSGGGATRADTSFPGDVLLGERVRGVDGCPGGRAITVNQMSGIIVVRAMPSELRLVERLLRSMQLSIARQVIIEAKILDVELNAGSQQGINWSAFRNGNQRFSFGGNPAYVGPTGAILNSEATTTTSAINISLGNLLGSGLIGSSAQTAFSSGLGMAIQGPNLAALINFLESQGRVHVLSSPRIATLNNQKAVIKVGSEEPYVTNISGGSTTSNNTVGITTIPATLAYQPFFSGIALDVTPQIDQDDNITLHVHSMVNSIVEKLKIAQPNVDTRVPFAANTINETDSVVKAKDGQVVVIGGLMTESTVDNRGGLPGLKDVPVLGAFFGKGAKNTVKRELVILLKPTVVKDATTWANEVSASNERINAMSPKPVSSE